ncbi:MAG TPA: BON domain-containing protein [Tepidiformaceae bacterium]|nr:BON domain-containing protein [Tepidiformaceae bacterium]
MATIADLERTITDTVGVPVTLERDGGRLVVTAFVSHEEMRDAILDLARDAAGALDVEDNIDVTDVLAGETAGLVISDQDLQGGPGGAPGFEEESLEAGDFQDQSRENNLTDGWSASGPTSAMDEDLVSEGDAVFVPPTDPVGTSREVIGGLQLSSMDSIEVARSSDGTLGDEAIADAIRRELREDSATTALDVDVDVYRGIARLRGLVQDLDDAENAEEIAARVPGVIEVREELDVESMG